jgi:hypothetical protein
MIAKFESYWDRVFIRAVELGCEPAQLGTEFSPLWGCTCPGRVHAHSDYGQPTITEASLAARKNLA